MIWNHRILGQKKRVRHNLPSCKIGSSYSFPQSCVSSHSHSLKRFELPVYLVEHDTDPLHWWHYVKWAGSKQLLVSTSVGGKINLTKIPGLDTWWNFKDTMVRGMLRYSTQSERQIIMSCTSHQKEGGTMTCSCLLVLEVAYSTLGNTSSMCLKGLSALSETQSRKERCSFSRLWCKQPCCWGPMT